MSDLKLHFLTCDISFHGFSRILNSILHSISVCNEFLSWQPPKNGDLVEVNCRLFILGYFLCVKFHNFDSYDYYTWKLNDLKKWRPINTIWPQKMGVEMEVRVTVIGMWLCSFIGFIISGIWFTLYLSLQCF